MDRNNLPGLSPLGLILLATVLGVFLPISTVAILGTDGIKASDWIGFSGSMLTAGIAVSAIYYAWHGIKGQLRAEFISREEDRIERELPGLREAEAFGKLLYMIISDDLGLPDFIDKVRKHIFDAGFKNISTNFTEIANRLPNTDIRTRSEYRNTVVLILLVCELAQRQAAKGADTESERAKIGGALDGLKTVNDNVSKRIVLLEERLPKIRTEIESHLF
jgi:hypothetical protein